MDAKYENYIRNNKLSKADAELELRSLDYDSFKEYSESSIKVEVFKNDGSCYPEEAGKILFHIPEYEGCIHCRNLISYLSRNTMKVRIGKMLIITEVSREKMLRLSNALMSLNLDYGIVSNIYESIVPGVYRIEIDKNVKEINIRYDEDECIVEIDYIRLHFEHDEFDSIILS